MPEVSAFCPACGRPVAIENIDTENVRDRILGAFAYFALLPAAIFLVLPALKRSQFIRFHAWQAVLFTISTLLLALFFRLLFIAFSLFPAVGYLLGWLSLGIGALGIMMLWVVLVVKAAQGDGFELPFIGPLATTLMART
jgi:uncharacterized membrane protein